MAGDSLPQPDLGRRPPVPPEVEGFVLHDFIGRGSSGMVWRATQDGTMREVALKVLAPWQAHGLAPLRFEREAEIAASLEHVAIARVFGAGECAAGPWLAMELVDGPPVDVWVRETNPPLRQRVEFFRQLCAGMSHAHQRGVIHRDLKPGNVLVTPEGTPKIVDFGLARRDAPSSLEVSLTREGDFLGTLAWMPPEQASGLWAEVDALSDVHALGAILFCLVAKVPPLEGDLPPAAQLAAAQGGERRRLREVDASAPRDLEAIVARCLAAAKADRYQSVAELEADVGRWLAGEPVRAPVGAPLYWVRKKLRRHWPAAAAIVVGLLSVAGLAAGYLAGRERVVTEKAAALRREAEQKARTLHEAQELVTQMLVEMRHLFDQAGHPEWIEEAEKRVADFPWDQTGGGAYDSRRFRGRSALVLGDILSSKGQWGSALEAYHDAIDNLKTLVSEQPEVNLFREELVQARLGSCQALIKLGFHKEAYQAAGRVLELTDPSHRRPVSTALTLRTIEAATLLSEATIGLPDRIAEALDVARRTVTQLAAGPPLAPEHAESMARLHLGIARLAAKVESREQARTAAARALQEARRFAELTGQGEISGRLLASALVVGADDALADGDARKACDLLNEATTRLGAGNAPPSLSDSPYVAVATAWENCATFIANQNDTQWAIDANDRAIETWGQIRRRAPGTGGLAALSRLCLANTRLSIRLGNKVMAARYGALTTGKMRAGLSEDKVRPPLALDTIEACVLMLEQGLPERGDDPSWRDCLDEAQRWMDSHQTRLSQDHLERRRSLAARIEALPGK